MRILMITSSYPTGKNPMAGTFVANMARALVDAGVEVMVAAPQDTPAPGVIPAIPIPSKSNVFNGPGISEVLKKNPAKIFGLIQDVTSSLAVLSVPAAMADVAVVHWLYPFGVAVALSQKLMWNIPIVIVLHSVSPLLFKMVPVSVLERTDLFIAVSEQVKNQFFKALGTKKASIVKDKTTVLPLGVPVWPAVVRELKREPLRLLFVGRLVKIKGADIGIKAVYDMDKVRLTVVGDGPLMATLKYKINYENTKLVGRVHPDEMYRIYSEHHVLIAPSKRLIMGRVEGLPMAIKEACSTGLPVISSPYGGGADFVRKYDCGWIMDRANSSDLKEIIEKILIEPDVVRQKSERALSIAPTLWWSEVIKEWIGVFKQVIA